MGTSDVLTYLGAATGICGCITGIVGALLGIKAYRRTSRDKVLDLRIQLHRDVRELTLQGQQLLKTISFGLRSRAAVSSALGMALSGSTQIFSQEAVTDMTRTAELEQQLVGIDELTEPDNLAFLERRLVEVHGVGVELRQLKSKYGAALAQDDADRNRIASRHEPRR
jgi:hypothetical protein